MNNYNYNDNCGDLFKAKHRELCIKNNNGNTFSTKLEVTLIVSTIEDLLKSLLDDLDDESLHYYFDVYNNIYLYNDFVSLTISFNKNKNKFKTCISFYGNLNKILSYKDKLKKHVSISGLNLYWYYTTAKGQTDYQHYRIEDYNEVYNEFYPWIEKDLNDYFEEFYYSDNTSLIMIGPPGTGKTTFISNLIAKFNYRTMVTSDESLFMNDEFFNTFMSSENDLLVIEDADLLILDRQKHNNKIMSKLLNSSDGLVKIKDKKIIFTANLTEIGNIDEALIRPGRCFDVVKFRELTYKEALVVANLLNVELIDNPNKDTYSLAEICNSKNKISSPKSIGFL